MTHNKSLHLQYLIIILILVVTSMTGCVSPATPVSKCTILFEDNDSLFFPKQIYEITQLDDLSISIGLPHGYRISSVNYEDYSLSAKTEESLSYDYYTLTLHHIRYSAVIRLTTALSYTTCYYDAAGTKLSSITEESPHLRFHTLSYDNSSVPRASESLLPIGWNTSPDGAGLHIGFGSRMDHSGAESMSLYLEQLACTPTSDFLYTKSPEGNITITGYLGDDDSSSDRLVIPAFIHGSPVTAIAENAFSDLTLQTIAIPPTIQSIRPDAFGSLTVTDFYLFDTTSEISDEAFGSYQITHLHINAATAPVYSGSYFDTLADKIDYLYSLREEQKLVLFCGSSARFGYDSAALEAAFPDYKVINMGVYAYSNMLPQAKLLLLYMKEGDVLLSSPELDAIDTQFCGETDLDKETFCMLESNYDMLSILDCRNYTNIFGAYTSYNNSRSSMTPRSYLDSPSYYDEDGNPLSTFSYNRYGDYIVFRENNTSGTTFGVKRAYYNASHIREQDLEGLNSIYDAFRAQGVQVLFTYSPRSKISISEDSSAESITELGQFFEENLHAQIISSAHASLMDPYYFYGTDNHLSTEGATLHTNAIIEKLRSFMED